MDNVFTTQLDLVNEDVKISWFCHKCNRLNSEMLSKGAFVEIATNYSPSLKYRCNGCLSFFNVGLIIGGKLEDVQKYLEERKIAEEGMGAQKFYAWGDDYAESASYEDDDFEAFNHQSQMT